jgi:hypothetical protein
VITNIGKSSRVGVARVIAISTMTLTLRQIYAYHYLATIIFLDYLAISLLGYSILFTIQFLSAVALDILLLYW